MNTKELILQRHSVRNYLPDPIPQEVLNDILEAGRFAPSAQNRQPWRYLVFTDNAKIQHLVLNSGLIGLANFFIRKAPCVIIACADTKANMKINGQDYYLVDTAISFQQMMLMAREHGVGSCWLAAFSEKKLRSYLKIPDSWRIVALSPFGYPADKKSTYAKLVTSFAGSESRKMLTEIVEYR
ncbi:MAG: nitroreductase family protein [Candidatus Cloacimonas sp.]|jgi:nitroreductase|nr:nitroreductase family protein [Candidatus Cloacimonas sp.]